MVAQICLYFVNFHLVLLFCATIMKFLKWLLKIAFCFISSCPDDEIQRRKLGKLTKVRLCMEMMWPQVDFCSGNIYNLSFSDKKNQSPQILPMSFFVLLKCRQNFEVLQLRILTPNKYWTKCPRYMTFSKAIALQLYFMEITTLISLTATKP